ncbi:MAG TPA: AMP-binding protein [Streptomyces sp.]|uniref:AMP-binding protein n=1 Tax=Streptomyces sp. TaxID=1931 RepID=UPI002D380B46|nr:AMP-binding protein [Streptomyces sp.]HZG04702.1 AMP-binding protein [Streptomyces sp.]
MSVELESTVPTGAQPGTLHEFMLAAAGTTPDRPAVVEFAGNGDVRVTPYRRLAHLVHEYAAGLDELGLDIGDRVVLESDTSAHAIAALLACSSLGLPFIPVSPETPDQRLRTILAAAEPALYLRAAGLSRDALTERPADGRFGPDGLTVERRPAPRVRHRRELTGTDTAYVIFTSGTTGRPKGVVMSHRAVLSFYRGMLHHGIVTDQDRVATTSPLQFDFSLLDIGLALGSGAAVVPVPRTLLRWPSRFLRVLRDTGATQVNGVPSIWRQALRHLPDELARLEAVRGVLFCGEEFPLPELRRLQQLLPHARLVNCYGATESMACSFTDVPNPLTEDVERLSIGFAHPGAEMTVIDAQGRPVEEPGVTGEIHLRSPALFTGYWDDPAATRAALVPDPLDPRSGQVVFRTGDLACRGEHGELYFCGRVDSQVQIRGNRVELGEVERRLLEFPGVTAATALVLRPPSGEAELAAFVVFGPGARVAGEAELAGFCRQALPGYMVPQTTFAVDGLPVTANGKVDRAALTAQAAERRGWRGDRTG